MPKVILKINILRTILFLVFTVSISGCLTQALKVSGGAYDDYELVNLLPAEADSKANWWLLSAEHRPVFMGYKYETAYLITRQNSTGEMDLIGKLFFDDREGKFAKSFVEYEQLHFFEKDLSSLANKHTIAFEIQKKLTQEEFDQLILWVQKNKTKIEGVFNRLFKENDGKALKGGVANFYIKSNDFVVDQMFIRSDYNEPEKWDPTEIQRFSGQRTNSYLFLSHDGSVRPSDEFKTEINELLRPNGRLSQNYASLGSISKDELKIESEIGFNKDSQIKLLKVMKDFKNKKGEDLFQYLDRVKKFFRSRQKN